VFLFERAAVFTTAAENVGDFRDETGEHCLQTTLTSVAQSAQHPVTNSPQNETPHRKKWRSQDAILAGYYISLEPEFYFSSIPLHSNGPLFSFDT